MRSASHSNLSLVVPLRDPEAGRGRDASLVGRARGGDRWAEEALYRAHVVDVVRVATRVLGRSAEAEDVVQDAFVTAFTRLDRLRDDQAFGGWLGRIVLNLARGRLRRRSLWRMIGLDEEDDASLAALASPGLDPDGRAELVRVDARLRTLPAEARVAWVLRHVEGWSVAEVADGLGVSLATAKRRLRTAEDAIAEGMR